MRYINSIYDDYDDDGGGGDHDDDDYYDDNDDDDDDDGGGGGGGGGGGCGGGGDDDYYDDNDDDDDDDEEEEEDDDDDDDDDVWYPFSCVLVGWSFNVPATRECNSRTGRPISVSHIAEMHSVDHHFNFDLFQQCSRITTPKSSGLNWG